MTHKRIYLVIMLLLGVMMMNAQNRGVIQNIVKQYQSGQISQEEAVKQARAAGATPAQITEAQERAKGQESPVVKETLEDFSQEEKIVPDIAREKSDQEEKLPGSDASKKHFGYELFSGAPEKFEPMNVGPVDPNYQVGPGDEIIVSLWGETELRYELAVSREGTVFINRYGQLSVVGLTIQELEKKLIRNLSRIYSGLNPPNGNPRTFLDVSLGKLRPIKVYFVGYLKYPGAHMVSSYSSLFTALYQVGGPTVKGSLRDIQLIRNNEVISHLDIYNFIMKGKKTEDARLVNNDVIYVPPRLNSIELAGEVFRQGIYEMQEGESLRELIEFSGGLKSTANTEEVQIHRVTPLGDRDSEVKVKYNLTEKLVGIQGEQVVIHPVPLHDQDIVTLFPLVDTQRVIKETPNGIHYVSVDGHVQNPGRFVLSNGMNVKQLIDKAGGLEDSVFSGNTYMVRADLIRYNPDQLTRKVIPIDLGDFLLDGTRDIKLQHRDRLILYPATVTHFSKQVAVRGQVKEPGDYDLQTNMGLHDLILRAGGFTKEAYRYQVEVFRLAPYRDKHDSLMEVFKIDISPGMMDKLKTENDFLLEDDDLVVIRLDPDYQYQRNVYIRGEVKFPGVYPLLRKNETLNELIQRAGGLTEEAFEAGIEFIRDDSLQVVGDFDEALKKAGKYPMALREGDEIRVPKHPGTVRVYGEVNNPGLVQYRKDWNMEDYIEAAGDYTFDAQKSRTVVYYPGGNAKRIQLGIGPKIKEGSRVYVPRQREREPFDVTEFVVQMSSIVSSVATTIFIIDRAGN